MRIKLIILASLQHQITSHASHSGVGPHERLLTRWEEPTVSWDHFASPAAALECRDLQSPGLAHIDPDILIQAARPGSCLACSRLDLQKLFLAAAMVNQAGSFSLCLYQECPALRHLTQALMFLSLKQGFPNLHSLVSFEEGQKKCFLSPSNSPKVPVSCEPNAKLGAPSPGVLCCVPQTLTWEQTLSCACQDGAELGEAGKGPQQVQGNGSKLLRFSGQAFRR